MASSKHHPTEATRAKVEALAAYGITLESISREIGVSVPTLRKYYRDELAHATQRLVAKVANELYNLAIYPPPLRDRQGAIIYDAPGLPAKDTHNEVRRSALMFLAKTRGHWRDSSPVVAVGDENGAPPVVVVLPDNGRSA